MLKQPLLTTYTFQTCPFQKGCPRPAMRTPARFQEVSAPSLEEAAFSSPRSSRVFLLPMSQAQAEPQAISHGSRWSRGLLRPFSSGSRQQRHSTSPSDSPSPLSEEEVQERASGTIPSQRLCFHSQCPLEVSSIQHTFHPCHLRPQAAS